MGDRALIQFTDKGGTVSPVVYVHGQGYAVGTLLEETMKLMQGRPDDIQYASARFVGICHSKNVSNLSLGIWNKNELLTAEDTHGDAGCFVVDVTEEKWKVYCDGGYGIDRLFNCSFETLEYLPKIGQLSKDG